MVGGMKPSDLPQPTFLSAPKVATLCGVTRNTVCCWIREGKLPSYRTVGGKNLIRPGDLAAFMDAHHMYVPPALTELAQADEVATPEGETPAERQTSAEPAILVVDDSKEARDLIGRTLRPMGLPILEAQTGYEALHLLLQHPEIALIVLDLIMPGQHGSRTFVEIRQQNQSLPVIVVTGLSAEQAAANFGEMRPELIITKPFQPDHLLQSAQAYLADIGI